MNNKVVNKQIPLETIVKVANHLEDYKENYDRKFELEQNKNKNIPYGEKQWEYENGNTTINYTIEFKNGKNIKESDYNWFVGNLNQPSTIKSISIDLYVSFYTKSQNNTINDIYNNITVHDVAKEEELYNRLKEINKNKSISSINNFINDDNEKYNSSFNENNIVNPDNNNGNSHISNINSHFLLQILLMIIRKIKLYQLNQLKVNLKLNFLI